MLAYYSRQKSFSWREYTPQLSIWETPAGADFGLVSAFVLEASALTKIKK
jgi:hypothetical protein